MEETIYNAKKEIKRADHLLYVSLKYTRTVDVIKSLIDRIINAYDLCMQVLLLKQDQGKAPEVPVARANLVKKLYPENTEVIEAMEHYLLLRKIARAEFTKAREFRRHVTMTVIVNEEVIEMNIDRMHEEYDKVKEFVSFVEGLSKE